MIYLKELYICIIHSTKRIIAYEEVLEIGNQRDDRTHTGTISKFGHQLRFDLSKGFPLLTTKKFHLN